MTLRADYEDNELDAAVRFNSVPRHMVEAIQAWFPSIEICNPWARAKLTASEKDRERLREKIDPKLVTLFLPIVDSASIAPILECRPMLEEAGISLGVSIWAVLRHWSLLRKLPPHVTEYITALGARIQLRVETR